MGWSVRPGKSQSKETLMARAGVGNRPGLWDRIRSGIPTALAGFPACTPFAKYRLRTCGGATVPLHPLAGVRLRISGCHRLSSPYFLGQAWVPRDPACRGQGFRVTDTSILLCQVDYPKRTEHPPAFSEAPQSGRLSPQQCPIPAAASSSSTTRASECGGHKE